MAAGILPRPGSRLGPCRRCAHRDCRETRSLAVSRCRFCGDAIGYDVRFYRDPDGPGFVHARCLEDDAARDERITP